MYNVRPTSCVGLGAVVLTLWGLCAWLSSSFFFLSPIPSSSSCLSFLRFGDHPCLQLSPGLRCPLSQLSWQGGCSRDFLSFPEGRQWASLFDSLPSQRTPSLKAVSGLPSLTALRTPSLKAVVARRRSKATKSSRIHVNSHRGVMAPLHGPRMRTRMCVPGWLQPSAISGRRRGLRALLSAGSASCWARLRR